MIGIIVAGHGNFASGITSMLSWWLENRKIMSILIFFRENHRKLWRMTTGKS